MWANLVPRSTEMVNLHYHYHYHYHDAGRNEAESESNRKHFNKQTGNPGYTTEHSEQEPGTQDGNKETTANVTTSRTHKD